MKFISYQSKNHPHWLSHPLIPKLTFSAEELKSIGVNRDQLPQYSFTVLTEAWRNHPAGARVIACKTAHHFWIEEIEEEEVEATVYSFQVKLTLSEIAQLPDAEMSVPNRIRVALGFEPRQHGGVRAGGFEPGNRHARNQA